MLRPAPQRLIYATTNLSLPLNHWIKLSTRPVWVDGAAQWGDAESLLLRQRFYHFEGGAVAGEELLAQSPSLVC